MNIDCLLYRTVHHLLVRPVRDGEEMGRHLVPPLADVHLDDRVGVDRVAPVRVDHHAEQARVGVDELGLVAGLEIPQDGRVIEVRHVGHVLTLLHLGRVDLLELGGLEGLGLPPNLDLSLVAIDLLQWKNTTLITNLTTSSV